MLHSAHMTTFVIVSNMAATSSRYKPLFKYNLPNPLDSIWQRFNQICFAKVKGGVWAIMFSSLASNRTAIRRYWFKDLVQWIYWFSICSVQDQGPISKRLVNSPKFLPMPDSYSSIPIWSHRQFYFSEPDICWSLLYTPLKRSRKS